MRISYVKIDIYTVTLLIKKLYGRSLVNTRGKRTALPVIFDVNEFYTGIRVFIIKP